MILAFLDLSYQSGARMLSRTAAAHALSAVACMHLTAVALLFMLLELPWSLGPLGAGGLAILIAYLFCLRLIALDQRCQQVIAAAETRETDPRHSKKDLRRSLVGYFTCVLVVLAAAPLLAITADHLAAASGLGGTFVGTSMVALATSLPEVVTTRTAVKMGAYDMAIGNILGSNAFNIAIIPAVDLFFDGPLLASISSTHSVTAAAVILITGVAAMGLLYRAEKRYFFFEPDAALVIVLSIASLGLVYWIG
jgi:cation:H+ antiporter